MSTSTMTITKRTSVANIIQKKRVKRQRFATHRLSRSKFIDEETKKSKTLKEMNNEINEKNHKRLKTFDKKIDEKNHDDDNKDNKINRKIIFDKRKIKTFDDEIVVTIKSNIIDDVNSDELMIDDKLNPFRILNFLSIDELKNAKTLLRFARNFDQQIHDLFQHIEIFFENIDEISVSTIDKVAIVDLINVYKH